MKRPEDYGIKNYEWIDGRLDVYENVNLSGESLTELPFEFGIIYGYFNCSDNELTSLKNSPIGTQSFYCHKNKLTSLIGSPNIINGNFDCSNNKLTNLKDSPQKINGDFDCHHNLIESLNICPKEVNGNFDCSFNKLKILDISTKISENFFIHSNFIESIRRMPKCKRIISDFTKIELNKLLLIEKSKNKIRAKMRQLKK